MSVITNDTTYEVFVTTLNGKRTSTGPIFPTLRRAKNEARRWSWQTSWIARVEVVAVERTVAV